MSTEITSPFPSDWMPQLIRREPSEFAHVLRDEVRDVYASIPEVKMVVVQRTGDRYPFCDVWLYFEMFGWDENLIEEIVRREFMLRELDEDLATTFSFHYIPLALPFPAESFIDCEN